jgi:hypothetical protein
MQPEQGQDTQVPDAQPTVPGAQASAPSAPGVLRPSAEPLERRVFRLSGAVVAWWAWVVVVVACLVDLAVSGRDHASAEIAVALVVVTGIMYACALRPIVIADSGGITVRNPLRDHRIPWGLVTSVDLGESVRVHCAREPGARREKVVHSWALYAQRRSRIRADLTEQRARARSARGAFASDSRLPAEAQRLARQPTAQIMAGQLDEMAAKARARGAAAGPHTVTWAWQPAVAIAAPAIALVLVIALMR